MNDEYLADNWMVGKLGPSRTEKDFGWKSQYK